MWQTFKLSLAQLFYPSQCLHCGDLIPPLESTLCSTCSSLLELIDPAERCSVCFEYHQSQEFHACTHCQKQPSLFYQTGAAFDYFGPAASLIKKLKYGNQPHLAKGMAAFLVAQFIQLDWPLPDALVPVPLSFSRWVERGYNQSELLAREISHFLKVPVWQLLKRKSGDYSQAALNLDQRQLMKNHSFKLKNNDKFYNKTLLLIDDVVTSGSTLNQCAECLMVGHPAALYSLTFCKTSTILI